MGNEKINYEYWKKIITRAQIGMAISIFVVEVVVNTILYVTRSQGYGPDTIVAKLIRYLLLTTLFNILVILSSYLLCKKIRNVQKQKYILTLAMAMLCFNTAYSHYQFTPTFLTFIIPIMFSILYEDKKCLRSIWIIPRKIWKKSIAQV